MHIYGLDRSGSTELMQRRAWGVRGSVLVQAGPVIDCDTALVGLDYKK